MTSGDFTASLGCLIDPALAGLAAQLGAVGGLGAGERRAVLDGLTPVLVDTVHRKVSRVLVLELNAARVTGKLGAADAHDRWDEFLVYSSTPGFWDSLDAHYPTFRAQLRTVVDNRCAATLLFARRFAADRPPVGELAGVDIGAGDSHRGGQSVAILRGDAGSVVYKPRSVAIDAALTGFLDAVLDDVPADRRIRVPAVDVRDGYGWVERVSHRYCDGDAELAAFYRGIGHWLAAMRLLGGSDLHSENLIACGPVPVVVDCETLFTPLPPAPPSGLGAAVDLAGDLVSGTVLRTGLLPGRGLGLGWRGVDSSAVGSLPGQQPAWEQPVIVDAGTDTARLGTELVAADAVAENHPSPDPALARYWDQVLDGFGELTGRLRALDDAGDLAALLAPFADCPIRVVPRATEVYAELARMLWHPVSLHDQAGGIDRATRLLVAMTERMPGAPNTPDVVAAEIDDLLHGDVPFFTTTPRRGQLDGPGGTHWLPESDLVADALDRWRAADLPLERRVIQAALVGAYLNDGWLPDEDQLPEPDLTPADLAPRRRRLAAGIVRQVVDAALRGHDGTAAWIAPVLSETGWAVQPLSPDLYGGTPGVAVLLAGYEREVAAGRADAVDGVDELLAGALATVRRAEDERDRARRAGTDLRPPPAGGYIGLGSQIWAWLLLQEFGAAGPDGLDRARALADLLPAAVKADDDHDLLLGSAGAIVPLLGLSAATGEDRWTDAAAEIGVKLLGAARTTPPGARTTTPPGACWPSPRWPDGLGGFAHGATGIAWALDRLARATGDGRFAAMAEAGFAFEEGLYDGSAGGWTDLREADRTASAWCHGAVGIGLAAASRTATAATGAASSAAAATGRASAAAGGRSGTAGAPDGAADVLRRAAAAAWTQGLGWNHTLCHGDLGAWEVLDAALAAGVGPAGLDRTALDARIVGSIEENGPVSGIARDAFAPGLLPGLGGVAYQLLRMDPATTLPSVLIQGGGVPRGDGPSDSIPGGDVP